MHCPNCDTILGGGRCQSCGWTLGQHVTRNEVVNPRKERLNYPDVAPPVVTPPAAVPPVKVPPVAAWPPAPPAPLAK